ncbi:MAG: hypothetical protein Q9201_004408 [Fulgogasparrea decipioides]
MLVPVILFRQQHILSPRVFQKPALANLHRHRTGGWLPNDHKALTEWVDKLIQRTATQQQRPLDPVLQRFKDFIDNNAMVRMLATNMFAEIPNTPPFRNDPTGLLPQVRNYKHMLELMNTVISEGPQVIGDPATNGLIGFPISAILEGAMGTQSGFSFFTMPSVNEHFKAILNEWKTYLMSPASQDVLNGSNGWTSSNSIRALTDKGNNGVDNYTFEQLYKCPDPSKPALGFKSWDAFFLREFQDGVRPIASPDETDVVVNACESTPYRLEKNVQLYDSFWLKGQPYSLADMLNDPDVAAPFVNGTVYQAFLPALSYHRWHAPVSGKVISTTHVPGTYYSENIEQGFANPEGPDLVAPNNSQAYLAEVATRAIIIIEADNAKIGRMAGVFIGMCEVSSCEFCVESGQHIVKGQQIGTFHYGGSSHCLVFRPQTDLVFEDPGPYDDQRNNKKVNSLLASVK